MRARIVAGRSPIELPPRMQVRDRADRRRPALVCGTGYTGEDGVELLLDPESRRRSGPSWSTPASSRAGSAPATRCASRSASTSTATTSTPERNPIEAGLGWCCKEETGFIGSEAIAAARERRAGREAGAVRDRGRGHPTARATRSSPTASRSGEVTSGTFSPSLEVGIGMAYVRAELAEPGTEVEIDVRGKRRPARIGSKPLYRKES